MNVEVINTGTELLLGDVVNAHAAWFGKQLFPLGLRISRQTTVPDGDEIRQAFSESIARAQIVLVTGGLGPTTDDLTREVVAEALELRLEEDGEIRSKIEHLFSTRGIVADLSIFRQAMVPQGAIVLPNDHGTAPGLYIPKSDTAPHIFLFPGPPRELQPMFDVYALPLLRTLCGGLPERRCRIYRIVGLGESAVEGLVRPQLSHCQDLEIGYCARPKEVDLRLIGSHAELAEVDPFICQILGENLVSQQGESLEQCVIEQLRKSGCTLATAESCTGGLLAHRLTNIPGASQVFLRGYVTYSNESKVTDLGVSNDLLTVHGSVSESVAQAMAEGCLSRAGSDFSLALTGIAGPDGGTYEKPVGTLFLALAQKGKPTLCTRFLLANDRETFKQLASQAALDTLRRTLLHAGVGV